MIFDGTKGVRFTYNGKEYKEVIYPKCAESDPDLDGIWRYPIDTDDENLSLVLHGSYDDDGNLSTYGVLQVVVKDAATDTDDYIDDIDVIGAEDVPGKYPFNLVDTANENLKKHGKEIQIVEHADEPGIYCLDVLDIDKDGNTTGIDTYADNYDIDQLPELVNEAWAHVLAKVKGIGHVDPVQEIRILWEKLDGTQKVDMMVEFFSDLLDAEKDRFLLETDNQ